MNRKMRVLVVGQTPPPYGGQAVMIQQLLDMDMSTVEFFHVRMSFSEDMDAIGRFRLKKLVHLVAVVWKIWLVRMRYRPCVFYYPPAGPNRVPFYRDAVLLILTRWMFKHTVFHFHASGISTLYAHLTGIEQFLFRRAYFSPSVGVHTSELNPDDAGFLKAKNRLVIENGLPDFMARFQTQVAARDTHVVPRILFVGALYESKGIRILIEACAVLKKQGVAFELECVGRFESLAYEQEIKLLVENSGLSTHVIFQGVLTGDSKWEAYSRADIFCFPSFFESESFGLVNIEAMQFALPVVSTVWRGIPCAVQDDKSGFLVEIQSPQQVAEKLAVLLADPAMRYQMGQVGRRIFLERFSQQVWAFRMETAFASLEEGL